LIVLFLLCKLLRYFFLFLFSYFRLFVKPQKDLVMYRFSFLLIVLMSMGLLSGCSGIQDMLKGDQGETGSAGEQGVTGNIGAQGPAGPALSGRWVGHMYLLELDGRLASDHSGITVTLMAPVSLTSVGPSLPSSVQTDATGQFVFPEMVTGLYSLSFSKEGYGTTYYYNMSFTGGGDQPWGAYGDIPVDTALIKSPDFQIESISNSFFNFEDRFYIKVNTNALSKVRSVILFWSDSESVSSQNYMGYRSVKINADGLAEFYLYDSYDYMPSGDLYFKAYPVSHSIYSQQGLSIQWPGTYSDRVTGRLTFTNLGEPSATLMVERL
jgi:hypothetical protein